MATTFCQCLGDCSAEKQENTAQTHVWFTLSCVWESLGQTEIYSLHSLLLAGNVLPQSQIFLIENPFLWKCSQLAGPTTEEAVNLWHIILSLFIWRWHKLSSKIMVHELSWPGSCRLSLSHKMNGNHTKVSIWGLKTDRNQHLHCWRRWQVTDMLTHCT